uniref:Polyprotein allergen nematode domain-containing protein n=1 Tax=Panagrolaimus superbus TaxID=310955 RepID=A0A914Y946_9BILA
MFKSRCIDFFGSETVEFIHGLHDEKSSVSIFDNFLIENPNDTFALRIKAEILFRAYRFEEALELYDSILLIEEDPLSITIIEKKKADALAFLERFDEAILIYEKYLETDENSEISDKLINALIRRADQSYDKATETIFKKHFEGNLEWLNEKQKRIIRRLKVEGKKAPEIFLKINEFFDQLEDEEAKHDAIHSIEHGCIRILYSVFGILKAEELINLRDNSTQGFQIKYKEFFDNLSEEGQKRIANAYMSSCQKVLTFDSEESIPPNNDYIFVK